MGLRRIKQTGTGEGGLMQRFVSMPIYNCKICDYEWVSRAQFKQMENKWIPIKGKACPFCKSHNWDKEKIKTIGRIDGQGNNGLY